MTTTKKSGSMTSLSTTLREVSRVRRSVVRLVMGRCATLLTAVAVSFALVGFARAASLTWTNGAVTGNWNTTDLNWDDGGPTAYTDGGVDDVEFDGTAPGTITIQTGGVTANSMTLSSGTYEFTGSAAGDTLKTTPITLSGGTLQYNGAGRLGTGQINVTGNATIEATGAAAQQKMDNSAIVVSDGVTLDLKQTNGGGTPGSPSIAPISGGSFATPITVNINPVGGTNAYVLSSGSTFIGDVNITNRVYLPTSVTSSMFGDLGNTIYGSIEARLGGGGGSIDQDIVATSGGHRWFGAGTGLILNGSVTTTGGELTGGTIRFTKPGNSLGSWTMNQGYVLEFAHDGDIGFSALTTNGSDNGGNGFQGKTIRWVGAGVNGSASTNLTLNSGATVTANIDVVDATSTANWSGNWIASNTNSTTIEKEGAGTLNWTGNSTGSQPIVINVNGGTLNINSTVSNIGDITVADGATFGGTGTITLESGSSLAINSGGSVAPGNSPGTLTLNGDLVLDSGSLLSMELGATGDLIDVNGAIDGPNTPGGIVLDLSSAPGYLALTPYVLLEWNSSDLSLSDFVVVSSLSGELSIVGNQLLFTGSVPEPSSLLLLGLGAMGLAVRRRRREVVRRKSGTC